MAELVKNRDGLIENVLTMERYGNGSKNERRFHARRIKNGKWFVVVKSGASYFFAPSKFAGYEKNDIDHERDLSNRDGRDTNRLIGTTLGPAYEKGDKIYGEIDKAFLAYCEVHHIEPSKHHRPRRYWLILQDGIAHDFPDELEEPEEIYEGAKQRIFVNKYERDPKARKRCIERFGLKCSVCCMDFEEVYGLLGRGFIHVHHLISLSEISARYKVNPEKDLRPVCPNCHAMLHRRRKAHTIESLKALLSRKRS